ncbi:MAG TPA: PD-(D/E)XK nuclease family protein [Polyangiaceae bacterium]|jgi:CRISPR/Cas system-associated exonuclease Cas4 (RecB family)|nr:PD-(D/E)XK nuclease family protein [Polyangiaceae bacterium]
MIANPSSTVPYLSCSQIRTFLQCPRQYHFRYVEKVPPEFRSVALAFGTAWHQAVGHFLGKSTVGALVTVEELREVFRTALESELADDAVPVLFDDDESSTDGLVAKGREMFEEFVDRYRLPDRVLAIEEPFLLELMHPATGEAVGVPLVGAIDALVERDGSVVVTEFKSSKRRWSTEQLEHDIQITTYLAAARKLGYADAGAELVITTKSRKPDLQLERLVRGRGDYKELAELALGVIKAVDAGVDHRIRGWQCRSCAHAGACAP